MAFKPNFVKKKKRKHIPEADVAKNEELFDH